MSYQATIKRYTIIIEKLQGKSYPSAEYILEHLRDVGLKVSERSLQRDFSAIRYEFGIEIVYDRNRKGYCIKDDSNIDLSSFTKLLEMVNTSDLLMECVRDGKEMLRYLSFDGVGDLKGLEFFRSILYAIKLRQRIAIEHFNFHTGKTSGYTIEPCLLKQYQNRWYLCGKLPDKGDYRTFGLDRINKLKILDEKFKPDKVNKLIDLFAQVVGLNFSEGKREIVKISFQYPQANYIKTLPLHTSQEIESDDGNEMIVSLYVIPNFELVQKILIHVANARVLQPQWLADEIREHLSAMLKKYG